MKKMKSSRKTAIVVAILFLVATLTFMMGSNLIKSNLNDESQNMSVLISGVVLEIICGIAVVGIGALMFPILKLFNKKLAFGYVVFRCFECTIIIVGGIYLLTLLKIMWKYEIIIFVFTAVGGLMFSYLLFQSKLIPRYLSALGLIGYAMLFLGAVLNLFNIFNISNGIGIFVYLPGGLFELFLPVWLFIKGFNSSAIVSAHDEYIKTIKKMK
jgi:hypothetical protein